MRQVYKPVICILSYDKRVSASAVTSSYLAYGLISRKIAMINPHVGGLLDGDAIAVRSEYLGTLYVPDDYILLPKNGKTNASQS